MRKALLALLAISALSLANVIPISSLEELAKIGKDPAYPRNGHYKLMNDIDATPTRVMNSGMGWEPIGKGSHEKPDSAFRGVFDGNFKSIRGLYINRINNAATACTTLSPTVTQCTTTPENNTASLLGFVHGKARDSAYIMNLHLDVDTIISGAVSAGIATHAYYTVITNCYVTGGAILRKTWNMVYNDVPYSEVGAGILGGYGTSFRVVNCYVATYPHARPFGAVGIEATQIAKSVYSLSTNTNKTRLDTTLALAEMKRKSSFSGWDFENIWQIDEGESFPYFRKDGIAVKYGAPNNSYFVNAVSLRGRVLTVAGEARIVDMMGKTIARYGAGKHAIRLPKGAYMVEVRRDGRRETSRMVAK